MVKNKQGYIEKYGEKEGLDRYNRFCANVGNSSLGKNSKEGFIKRYGIEEGTKRYETFVNKSKQTLGSFIQKYGEETGKIKYQQYVAKKTRKFTSTKRFWLERGYTEKEAKKMISSSQSRTKLEDFIRRYGEYAGEKKYILHYTNHSFALTLKGFVERYGADEGESRYYEHVSSRDPSLKGFIKRWGEEQGRRKYKQTCKKKAHSKENYKKWYSEKWELKWSDHIESLHSPVSKQSKRFFIPLYKWLRKNGIDSKEIYWGIKGSKEYFFKHNDGFCFCDFVIPKLKLVIEYNGSHIHPKPHERPEIKLDWIHCFTGETFDEVLNRENIRRQIIQNNGFQLIEVWSDEINEKTIEYLKGKINEHLIERKKI